MGKSLDRELHPGEPGAPDTPELLVSEAEITRTMVSEKDIGKSRSY